ncbi:MAG: 50S ribosomal protein L16 [Candidatus Aenigmarchaeota archaeon]|nr:50S ribosomal protein L16 [Candidatus Aenigmarchaeota archaeon]
MAKLRPGRCYRKLRRPYTRQSKRNPRKGYVKGVPGSRISQFEMGTKKDYDVTLYLVSDQTLQIRHNALEAARMAVVKTVEKATKEFFIKLRVYPHHVLRENRLATGAGADRFQQGMRHSFGVPIGTAAQVRRGQKIFEVRVNKEFVNAAKEALNRAKHKLPLGYRIVIEEKK